MENELKELAIKLDVANKVDFEGFRENMIPYYLGAKLTLLTSLYEGFPNVLIESITLGTPVVAFDCQSGPREIITKYNGVLVENGNVEKLEHAISMLLKETISSSSIIESAEKYKMDVIVNEWENLILNVQEN
ncbi:putative poly(glycerol-phosphate) alpha-glucosyltransferase [compost metagenome]